MVETKGARCAKYFPFLLDALRSKDPTPMRPAEATAWIREKIDIEPDHLTRFVKSSKAESGYGSQSIFVNDVNWARFYLVKAGLLYQPKRGLWALTGEGRNTRLTAAQAQALFVRVNSNRPNQEGTAKDEEEGPAPALEADEEGESTLNVDDIPSYTVEDILGEGCFLSREELSRILERWRAKKNLVLQGPPGTGKSWLASRLAFALVGSKDRDASQSRLRAVQFHPSLAYEDFVRGWRPGGDGKLALVDGILMQVIQAAASEPDRPFVLVIEEINRGNPAQIFGEMLTLLENTKRRPSEAIELAYRKIDGERVHVPKNLFVIGTMNVADRSLAIVDLALRRRFAFVDLEPRLGAAWREWCKNRGLDDVTLTHIGERIEALNLKIFQTTSLGAQFRIGHSYVTPDSDDRIVDGEAWFKDKIETEIGPLIDEYWYDIPETARELRAMLLAPII